ncbi:winged helix-turn-helix transcriptional regulator [Streptomyces nigrescens]
MNHQTTVNFDTARVERTDKTVALLAAPGTTRLLNELIDFGPLPRRHQGSPFPELPSYQVCSYMGSLRQRNLVETRFIDGEETFVASEAAGGLGDVYDTLNRWAKTHLPHTAVLPYVARVHEAVALLNEPFTVPILAALSDGPRTPDEIEQLIAPCTHSITAQAAVTEHLPRLATRGLLDHADRDPESVALTEAGQALLTPLAAIDSWSAEHSHVPVSGQRRPVGPTLATAILPARPRAGLTR